MLESHQRDARATIVGCVLAQSQFAIQLQIIDRDEVRVFVSHATRALFKFLAILFGPPVVQVPLRIELSPLIVEAVSEFVTNDKADAAKVDGVVNSLVEERRLQNAGWKHD